ncbi:MAG TPA: valine--tRNA ligase [Tepidisphaeraceae bacterium]|jgi:valyl-tRNA synthetase|nr:valine--tRNA ligase [Tepidisphaeraceae bacterium]
MSGEVSRTYEPASIEAKAYEVWLEERCFAADPAAPGEPYCIVIPPPNVTGALHLGHAINNTLQDILIRMHRMRGFNTLWIPGIDHAGIATQAVVEKQLKEKENKTRHDIGREALVERIWQWKQQFGDRILEQLKRLGCSCDWDRARFTLDEQCARAVRETFFKLFKDGLIYRGKRLVNWDVHLQTSISDDEIYHETVKTSLWHVKYPIVDTDKFMTVATTRPETMLGDTAVAVHSEDSRWNWAIGKFAELPLTGRKIPIIADDILVDPKFGSGVVKVTPAHDPNDYAVWQRQQGKIEIINILNPDGTINQNGGKYAGMKRDAARKKVVEDLTALGLLAKEEPYETPVGHSDRSKTPVEPYLSDQWFVKMAALAEPALQVVRDGIIKFFPERHAQQYLSWLGEKRDWPISRQLWWGHRIPVWIFLWKGPYADAPSDSQHVLMDLPYLTPEQNRQIAVQVIRPGIHEIYVGISVRPGYPDIERLLEEAGGQRDPDVLDTWFSSALWPHSTLGWPDDTPDLRKWYPTSVLVTAREIITLWVARMVMTGLYNMKKVPFHHVYIHTVIQDGHGEPMKKSKGNGVDPVDVIDTHGADALRFTLTHMATETQDVRLPVKKDAQGRNTSDKFDIGRNFSNKIWQVANFFVIQNLANPGAPGPEPVDETKWSLADRWIVSRFNRTVGEADAALALYRFDQYAKACYDFVWDDFCAWHVEASKPTLKDPARAGQIANVLAAVLDGALRLMHPIIPFITETIWWRLNEVRPRRGLPGKIECPFSKRLILAKWPSINASAIDEKSELEFSRVRETSSAIRNLRNQYNIEPKAQIEFRLLPAANTSAESIAFIQSFTGSVLTPIQQPVETPSGSSTMITPCGQLFFHPFVDASVEGNRIAKRKDELNRQIQTLRGRLGNEAYISKAPAHLVQQTKDQLAGAEAELAKLG